MDIQGLLIFLLVGAIAGFLAGKLMKGGGFGLLADIIVGIIGAVVGSYLFGLAGIVIGGIIGEIITATVGAMVFILVVRLLKRV